MQNGHHFADDNLKFIFINENHRIWIQISINIVHKGPINNMQSLV